VRLLRLRLENFRQFSGEQEISFAADREENVTLIYGANGSGKTTLLNAFTWVLYGSFTKDFEQPEILYNLDQWSSISDGDRMKVAVELEFENAGSTLTMRRVSVLRKVGGGAILEEDAKPDLTYIDETGRSQRSGNPDDHIRQILPDRLHSFFFFNGERIEHLVQASAYEEIEDAIKTILGLSVVERAIKHLPTTAKKFEEVLRIHGSDEQREIASELESLDQQVQETNTQLEDSRRTAGHWQDEIDTIAEKLRGSEQVREKQHQRDELNAEDARLSATIDELGERLNRLIRERGFFAPGLELFKSTSEQFADKREKKELPAPVKRDFIEDLLEDGTCICGASLAEGTPGHEHISEWRQRAGLAEVEQRWNELHSHAGFYIAGREEMRQDLETLLDDRGKAVSRRQLIREQLSELSRELQDGTTDDIAALEGARLAADRKKDEEVRRQGRLERDLEGFVESKAKLEAQLKRAESGEAKAELARRRLTVTREALSTLERIFEIRTEQTRTSLDQQIKEIYGGITFKPYIPEVSPKFQLDLFNSESGEPVAKSTGENQILSLSFVGALAAIARARYEETTEGSTSPVGARGGIYPIVMDAAFGSLDEGYRRDVARGLPALAEQVVVMVSKSGGDGAVEHLSNKIGKSYVIRYVTPKPDAKSEKIVINEHEYAYVEHSDDGSEYAILSEAT
jgi:DNA sulfur modification protein DndD